MNMFLQSSAMIPALEMYLNEITERQIERDGSRLNKKDKGDTVLGALTSDLAKRLWSASNIIKAKEVEATGRAAAAPTDEEELRFKAEAKQMESLAELCRDMAWYEIRESLGYWDDNCGLREGWVIVKPKEQAGPEQILRRLFGGGE